ncbi:MAG: hypothetical protein KJ025_13360 [Burkholderiales bacterium]|nr:hypothetical protein [Burkholderiales bacterium]
MDPLPLPAAFVRATLAALDLPPRLAERYAAPGPARPPAAHPSRSSASPAPPPARAVDSPPRPFPGA